jgi:NAD(P)-dependent dehydrogenase (short-subunit alcohol dehydrogenase family)
MNVVLASTSDERLAKAVDLVRSRGGSAINVVCDVADRAAVRDLAGQAVAEFGAVHVICANAAVTTGGPFLNHRDEDWDWVYDVVLRGVTNCVQAFYPLLAAQREDTSFSPVRRPAWSPTGSSATGPTPPPKQVSPPWLSPCVPRRASTMSGCPC